LGSTVLSLDLDFDDAQLAVALTLAKFCAEHGDAATLEATAGAFPARHWRALAELGVLALATPEGDGGALELVAALEPLGAALFPGPLPATCLASQLLPKRDRAALRSGEGVVSLGAPPLLPWAPEATVFIEIDGTRAFRARPRGPVAPVDTLGGEPWGRVELERVEDLGDAHRALALHDLALAAYAAAAAHRLVEVTAEHARTRRQFGRAIGEFQAVAHPLADCAVRLGSAATLARAAAFEFDRGGTSETVAATAAAARLSASRAGLAAAHTCHQLFGAQGIALEGPVFRVSRRLRQLASQPPSVESCRQALLRRFDL
jgi:alkylation response protein AidB-like acyl-CoA dehydrogenase